MSLYAQGNQDKTLVELDSENICTSLPIEALPIFLPGLHTKAKPNKLGRIFFKLQGRCYQLRLMAP